MTRTLSMNVATSRIATGKGATVTKGATPPAPPARPSAPVKTSTPERVKLVAYCCIQPPCRSKYRLEDWHAAETKATTHACQTCGSVMATAVVYMPPIDVQTQPPAPRTSPGKVFAGTQDKEAPVTGSHAPGSRSARLLAALEKKMARMIEKGEKFTDEQVEKSADLREAANAWLLITNSRSQFVRDLKQRAEGQRSHRQLRGALNFYRAALAREMGIDPNA